MPRTEESKSAKSTTTSARAASAGDEGDGTPGERSDSSAPELGSPRLVGKSVSGRRGDRGRGDERGNAPRSVGDDALISRGRLTAYNAAIKVCGKAGRWDHALLLLEVRPL